MNALFPPLPVGWSFSRLDHLADVRARIGWKALTADEYVEEGYPFLSTKNLRGKTLDLDDVNYISSFRYEESPELQLADGDVLISKDGTLGVTALVKDLPRPATVNGSIAVIRPRGINAGYLKYFLDSDVIQGLIMAFKSGMGVPHLFQADLRKFPVVLPPDREQIEIADFLDKETERIDTLVAKKQRLLELLADRRTSLTRAGVGGELSTHSLEPSRIPWLGAKPAHWRTAKLSLVASMGSGHTPSRSHPEWWINCTIPWITTGEVAEMRSDREEYVSETREMISKLGIANSSATVRIAGTVVLCRTASAGYSAIMSRDMATSQDFATWTCGPLLRPRFLLLCLRAMRQDLLGRLAMGSTHQTIYMPDIESLLIPLPDLEEQDAIVERVWKGLREIANLEDRLSSQMHLLAERRQALITAAVTGQLELRGVSA
jgi:type I restriction enzyme S subunit